MSTAARDTTRVQSSREPKRMSNSHPGPDAQRSVLFHFAAASLAAGWLAASSGCATVHSTPPADQPLPAALLKADEELGKAAAPSNVRIWSPDQALLPVAHFDGNRVRIENIRNCTYFDADTYVLKYYHREINLDDVQTVDFLVMPFDNNPLIAHTMLSFGLADGTYLGVSVEIRKEDGEAYGPLAGFLNQYEIMYVIGDERDLVQLCTNHLAGDVYLYRTRATPLQARTMLVDVLERANRLRTHPEFYNTIANNCTTNIARHVNRLAPGKVPNNIGVILPGLADRAAYDLGLLDTELPFELAKQAAYVTPLAQQHAGSENFSQAIRQR